MAPLPGELSRQSPNLSHCKQAAGRAQHTGAGQAHDDARQQHTAHAGNENILELHVQNGGCQRTGPGTGAWTGTLAASILDMKFKDVLIACMGGVLLAGIIMGLASAGVLGAASSLFAV